MKVPVMVDNLYDCSMKIDEKAAISLALLLCSLFLIKIFENFNYF